MSSKLNSRRLKCVTGSHCLHAVSKKRNGSNAAMYAVTPNEGEIQTTIAGGLRVAYLMTAAHCDKELARYNLA